MPTNKPRIMITFNDKELKEQVETYRFEHRFKSQNDALMDLINKGIESLTGEALTKPKEEISAEDKRILKVYHAAEPSARMYAMQILENNPAAKEKSRA